MKLDVVFKIVESIIFGTILGFLLGFFSLTTDNPQITDTFKSMFMFCFGVFSGVTLPWVVK